MTLAGVRSRMSTFFSFASSFFSYSTKYQQTTMSVFFQLRNHSALEYKSGRASLQFRERGNDWSFTPARTVRSPKSLTEKGAHAANHLGPSPIIHQSQTVTHFGDRYVFKVEYKKFSSTGGNSQLYMGLLNNLCQIQTGFICTRKTSLSVNNTQIHRWVCVCVCLFIHPGKRSGLEQE